jgi:hypothetical protein
MPRLPPAPPWFSIKNCCPSRSESFAAISRPAMSVTPPAANGMMILTGFAGYCCAKAEPESTTAATSETKRMMLVICIPPCRSADRPSAVREHGRGRFVGCFLQGILLFEAKPAGSPRRMQLTGRRTGLFVPHLASGEGPKRLANRGFSVRAHFPASFFPARTPDQRQGLAGRLRLAGESSRN